MLAMPTVPHDQGYAIEIQIEETITAPFVVIQTAVLHTSCYGERRIRVITQALPTTTNLSEVYASVDQVALGTLLADKAVERSLTHKLEDARDYLFKVLVELLVAYKTSMTAGGASASNQLAIAENMKMVPALVLGLLKNVRHSLCFLFYLFIDSRWIYRLVSDKALKYHPTFARTLKPC